MIKKKKILFVAMQMSTHAARWINQIAGHEWDVHLFPVNYLPVHQDIHNVTVHQPWKIVRPRAALKKWILSPRSVLQRRIVTETSPAAISVSTRSIFPIPIFARMAPYLNGIKRVRLGESDATAPAAYGPSVLAKLIETLKPDLIHSLEFQHCGYNVLRAKELCHDQFPLWLATNWGSDIYYYQQFEEHRRQITRLLHEADFYSCECERDVELARGLGFSGEVMPVMPNTGGLDIAAAELLKSVKRTSERKVIMVKGYQHFAGRALTALNAVERCGEQIHSFRIIVFSTSPSVAARVRELQISGFDIVILDHVDHETMLRMFSRARIYLGVSISDAISTSMLEAIAMGAFPIQTDTSCCDEWVEDGISGFVIPADDVMVIADRLRQAMENDSLVDKAADINWKTVLLRLDQTSLKQKAVEFYETIFRVSRPRIR